MNTVETIGRSHIDNELAEASSSIARARKELNEKHTSNTWMSELLKAHDRLKRLVTLAEGVKK